MKRVLALEVIALSHFFASREANWGYRVSPDGTRQYRDGDENHHVYLTCVERPGARVRRKDR